MSDLAVVLLGFGIGLVIVATFFWFERVALRRGLQQRRAELFGETGQIENVSDSPSPIQPDGEAETFQHRRLGLAVCLIAFLGSAVLAIQTSDEISASFTSHSARHWQSEVECLSSADANPATDG